MVEPHRLCRQHLLGEHKEIHMLVGCLNKGRSIQGYLDRHQLAPQLARERHDELAEEMVKRGYSYQSPLPEYEYNGPSVVVDVRGNRRELRRRCRDCRRC